MDHQSYRATMKNKKFDFCIILYVYYDPMFYDNSDMLSLLCNVISSIIEKESASKGVTYKYKVV